MQTVLVVGPGGAGLAVDEETIERGAQLAREGAQTYDLDVAGPSELRTGKRRTRGAGAVAGQICPAYIRLRAHHPGAGLVLGSDLPTGKPSAGIQAELLRVDDVADEIVREGRLCFVRPTAAHMRAEIKPRPGEDHHGRRRRVHNRRGAATHA